jgi:RNA polymerase sigma-70 factor (ECF subfamily)
MSPADMSRVMATATDDALWRRTCAGDGDAFAELYERHADGIYRYLFRRLGSWTDAEDLTATVFLEAFRLRSQAAVEDGRVGPWLYGIATNVLHNRRRTIRRHRRALARLGPPAVTPDFAPDARARAAAEREAPILLERLAGLPRAQRDAFALCAWHGLSYEDAAAALGVPTGTVKSRVARARAAFDPGSSPSLRERGATR